ncbi:shikimate dehydrogenase [Idiomarina piscisalsi]|uniref:shikimate dehydrogenase n=1 Tax=Idiomarina piscisalsi TaxID=1096243 RepID=UPI00137F100B|nr:shikimate dehydrogenase [Idiomarina piscisalsi]MTJ01773.1 shikimate dehydrogenase [Idiomarina piscisalsi]
MTSPVRLGVFGNPVAHSLSPTIHSLFAELRDERILYERMLATPANFPKAVAQFFRDGGTGANVTLPFKEQAAQLANTLTERARIAGAVNTLMKISSGFVVGDNTDGEGFVKDLSSKGFHVSGCSLVLLGAGGSARGVLPALLSLNPAKVYLVNRTLKKAQALKQLLVDLSVPGAENIQVVSNADSINEKVDAVVNATSSSLHNIDIPLPQNFADDAWGYDLMYSDNATHFLKQLERAGIKSRADGLGMLIEQAASSYQLWMGGERPDNTFVMSKIRV